MRLAQLGFLSAKSIGTGKTMFRVACQKGLNTYVECLLGRH